MAKKKSSSKNTSEKKADVIYDEVVDTSEDTKRNRLNHFMMLLQLKK
jgi:hypothetical protein